MGQAQMPKNIAAGAAGGMQSQKMMMKGIQSGQIPTDLGLLPSTLVCPPLLEVIGMYRQDSRKRLLSVLWLLFKRRFRGTLG